jgi:tRNA (guanine-N7-)-methyltransferase
MEIGTGMGEATAEIARNFPETGFLAVDVHRPGVGKLFALIHEYGLKNLRVIQGDAHLIVHDMIANGSLDGIHLFFPDPWPKKRHLKRRIFQAPLLDALTRAMSAHGRLLVATDVADYAQWMLDQAAGAPQWRNLAGPGKLSPRLKRRVLTKFERRALRDGRSIHDFAFAPV